MKKPEQAFLNGKTENQGYPNSIVYSKSFLGWRCQNQFIPVQGTGS